MAMDRVERRGEEEENESVESEKREVRTKSRRKACRGCLFVSTLVPREYYLASSSMSSLSSSSSSFSSPSTTTATTNSRSNVRLPCPWLSSQRLLLDFQQPLEEPSAFESGEQLVGGLSWS